VEGERDRAAGRTWTSKPAEKARSPELVINMARTLGSWDRRVKILERSSHILLKVELGVRIACDAVRLRMLQKRKGTFMQELIRETLIKKKKRKRVINITYASMKAFSFSGLSISTCATYSKGKETLKWSNS